jgi:hypothetical protein
MMTAPVPLPLVDDLLLPYNVGQALILLFVLSVLGLLPLGSRKALALSVLTFGFIFALTPASAAPVHFRFLGLGLLVVAPMLYVTASE